MQRGKQYVRGIQLYYRKFGSYPPNVDALVKPTNGIRFLRKKYIDPTTGKDVWRPIQLGQNKAPTAMGFFGQPLSGTGSGGITGASTIGSPIGSSSGFGSSSTGFGTPTSGFGSSSTGSGSDLASSTGTTSTTGTSGDSSASAGVSSNANPTAGGITGTTGPTFGGAGIMGFAPTSPKQSLLVYKKKNHYNEWEFVYDPLTELKTVGGSSAPTGSNSASSISSGLGGTTSTQTTSPSNGTSLTPTQ
jgi:hypothetical protein